MASRTALSAILAVVFGSFIKDTRYCTARFLLLSIGDLAKMESYTCVARITSVNRLPTSCINSSLPAERSLCFAMVSFLQAFQISIHAILSAKLGRLARGLLSTRSRTAPALPLAFSVFHFCLTDFLVSSRWERMLPPVAVSKPPISLAMVTPGAYFSISL